MGKVISVFDTDVGPMAVILVGATFVGSMDTVWASGTLRVALTDAPACGYDAVNVTIERIRVHKSASAGEADAGWVDLVLTAPKKVLKAYDAS